jgi:hypothetical protein
MKYMLLMYANETETQELTQEEAQALFQTWQALLKEAKDAGVLLSNTGLSPTANATTVRVRDRQTLCTDGPFAETHEQLGGFFMLECRDIDEAIGWAAKIPHAKYGSVEIRPLWDQI